MSVNVRAKAVRGPSRNVRILTYYTLYLLNIFCSQTYCLIYIILYITFYNDLNLYPLRYSCPLFHIYTTINSKLLP